MKKKITPVQIPAAQPSCIYQELSEHHDVASQKTVTILSSIHRKLNIKLHIHEYNYHIYLVNHIDCAIANSLINFNALWSNLYAVQSTFREEEKEKLLKNIVWLYNWPTIESANWMTKLFTAAPCGCTT